METDLAYLVGGIPLDPLPPSNERSATVPHAPFRSFPKDAQKRKQAVCNALRYFPEEFHPLLGPEFAAELSKYGHIYMYRFLPKVVMKAAPIAAYPVAHRQCAAVMHMIMNNLDPRVAQFPEELVTYGGNGQVFSNWAQFWLVMHYLSTMTDHQTLVMYSGHPMGVFPSQPGSPRLVITNGMVIPNYSSRAQYDEMFGLGVSMYGQMTAGSYCYIGPQGIVHGTTITVMNAGRKYLNCDSLAGKVFVTSGLGGMSGAQAKAAVIAGCVGIIAEIDPIAVEKRLSQGWLMEATSSLEDCIERIKKYRREKQAVSIGYTGNIVDLWERLVEHFHQTGERLVDLGSDQTSCHNPYAGGYHPAGLTFDEANILLRNNPEEYKEQVKLSLCRHIKAVDILADAGMFFWDYGNAFLLECHKAGADVRDSNDSTGTRFKYPSYVQDIMGDIFSMGFGPFRWVCTSGLESDLLETDKIAYDTLSRICSTIEASHVKQQYEDNLKWIREAGGHKMVVGSQARILYSDQEGRVALALAFNKAISDGIVKDSIVISRDHHDVSGTDSPFRETSNIYDGSAFTADMAVQNVIGDSFRGATWVSLHNGGGVGWGEVINGGFGLVLDGSEDARKRAELMLNWDVSNGVARRCWSGNEYAREAIERSISRSGGALKVTLPNNVTSEMNDEIGKLFQ